MIRTCQTCGGYHECLVFTFILPSRDMYTHMSTCPTTGEQIYVMLDPDYCGRPSADPFADAIAAVGGACITTATGSTTLPYTATIPRPGPEAAGP